MRYCLISPLASAGVYALFAVCAAVSFYFALVLAAILKQKRLPIPRRWLVPRNALPLAAALVGLYFLNDNMFRRFSCVELRTSELRLRFLWPKGVRVIPAREVLNVRVQEDVRHRKQVVITTLNDEFRSVVCMKKTDLSGLKDAVEKLVDPGRK